MIRQWFRQWLGIEDLEGAHLDLGSLVGNIQDDIILVRNQCAAFLYDELDPRRKAASDALGKRQIARLEAEEKARKMTERGNG